VSLEAGLESTVEQSVTEDMTAQALGSGDVPLLGTPALLALVERAAVEGLSGRLGDGQTSVGASVELRHLAPTPVDGPVMARVRLVSIDGRTLHFEFEVTDRAGLVARGRHRRVVVDRDSFLASARAR
jgi:fluoroacetyl-CoA thioesterase